VSKGETQSDHDKTLAWSSDEPTVSKADSLVGTLFAGKYRIESILGEGGMSVVYLAKHEALGKSRALKTLHSHLTNRTSSLLRFQQEAKAASVLEHPGIVAMHDYGITDDGIPYLVMDYVDGESLADLIKRVGRLLPAHAVQIFVQATRAIEHAHEHKVLHRDIKPSNIMIQHTESGEPTVKIVDFGVAKLMSDTDDPNRLTQTGEAVGSPLYMSPEQCMGQRIDARSDVYSFGCVMYEAITGTAPFAGDSIFATMFKQMNDMPAAFNAVVPDLKLNQLEKIVFKALAKEPDKRYQSMQELSDDLAKLLGGTDRNTLTKVKDNIELIGLRTGKIKLTPKTILLYQLVAVLLALPFLGAWAASRLLPDAAHPPEDALLWPPFPDRVHEASASNSDRLKDQYGGEASDHFHNAVKQFQEGKLRAGDALALAEEDLLYCHILRKRGEYEIASREYEEILQFASSCPGIDKQVCMENSQVQNCKLRGTFGLAECLYHMRLYDKALPYYLEKINQEEYVHLSQLRKFIANDKEELDARIKLIDCYYRTRRFKEARKAIDDLRTFKKQLESVGRSALATLFYSIIADIDMHLAKEQATSTGVQLEQPLVIEARKLYARTYQEWSDISTGMEHVGNLDIGRCLLLCQGAQAELKDACGDPPVSPDIPGDRRASDWYRSFMKKAEVFPRKDPEVSSVLWHYAVYLKEHNNWLESMQALNLSKRYLED
jgi:serine/threonine protein kinase